MKLVLTLLLGPVILVGRTLFEGVFGLFGSVCLLLLGRADEVDGDKVQQNTISFAMVVLAALITAVFLGTLPWWGYFFIGLGMYIWEDPLEGLVSRWETWLFLNISWIKEVPKLVVFLRPAETFLVTVALVAIVKGVLG